MFITEHIDFIKSQIQHHERSIAFFESKKDYGKLNRHTGILRRFREILPIIEDLVKNPPVRPMTAAAKEKVGSRLGDLSDLPEEIRAQLVSVNVDEQETQIVTIIKEKYQGMASVDEIFVAMFREHSFDKDRDFLARKLYRMTKVGAIHSVPKKKGIYSIQPPLAAGEHEKQPIPEIDNADLLGMKAPNAE